MDLEGGFYQKRGRLFAILCKMGSKYFCTRLASLPSVLYILVSIRIVKSIGPGNLMQVLTLNPDKSMIRSRAFVLH